MRTVTVGLGDRAYPIHIGEGLLARADLILPHLPQRKVSVVTNTTVAALYLDSFSATLRGAGVEIVPVVLPDGEEYKNWPAVQDNMPSSQIINRRALTDGLGMSCSSCPFSVPSSLSFP